MSEATTKSGVLLAMDTSGDVCSVAVLRDGKLYSEHAFRHGMHLSENLMAHVDAVLHEADRELADVELFAVGVGPGSFTGTRIGVMTMKTLAVVKARRTYGIGGLEAIAMEYFGTYAVIVPMLPCRAGMVFAGIYAVSAQGNDVRPAVVLAPTAIALQDLVAALPCESGCGILFCGEAVERYGEELAAAMSGQQAFGFGIARCPRASVIGGLAWQRHVAGDTGDDPMLIVPHYISPPPISMPGTGIRMTRVEE